VITSKQFPAFEIAPHRLQFIRQVLTAFAGANRPAWLDSIKSEAGFRKVAGIELTLLDWARYIHQAAGINGVAQIVRDNGARPTRARWLKPQQLTTNPDKHIVCFDHHLKLEGRPITRASAEPRMLEKGRA
jgi:hypothetical protein